MSATQTTQTMMLAENTGIADDVLPEYAARLADALRQEFDAVVEIERTGVRENTRIIVRSEQFVGVPYWDRHLMMKKVIDRTITREQRMTIPLIMSNAPGD